MQRLDLVPQRGVCPLEINCLQQAEPVKMREEYDPDVDVRGT